MGGAEIALQSADMALARVKAALLGAWNSPFLLGAKAVALKPAEASPIIAKLAGSKSDDAEGMLWELAVKGNSFVLTGCLDEYGMLFVTTPSRTEAAKVLVDKWAGKGDWRSIARFAGYSKIPSWLVPAVSAINRLDPPVCGVKCLPVTREAQTYAARRLIPVAGGVLRAKIRSGDLKGAAAALTAGVDNAYVQSNYPPLPKEARTRLGLRLVGRANDPGTLSDWVLNMSLPKPVRDAAAFKRYGTPVPTKGKRAVA